MIYDVKHDGLHKARLVAGGHLTDQSTESVYSGVVSLRGIWLVVFLAELNKLELWGADVGNAYLEALTKEKVYIIAGPEFGELEGHTLLVFKALYGLRSSVLCWHQRFADVLWQVITIQTEVFEWQWREQRTIEQYDNGIERHQREQARVSEGDQAYYQCL
jgi:Reverse transcriptase (RNA-dependent DNA polymerase)